MVCRPRSDRICAPRPLSCCDCFWPIGRAVGGVVAESGAGLMEVDQHARAFLGDALQRLANQQMAFAIGGSEDVAIDAVRVHADQNVSFPGDLAVHQREVALRRRWCWRRRWS